MTRSISSGYVSSLHLATCPFALANVCFVDGIAMAAPSERSFGQVINIWVQTAGIIVAAVWAGYTFIYKEIVVPKSAPVNISVDLQLKRIGPGGLSATDQKSKLVAVELRVSATNPSTRTVYLLPSLWIAYGLVDRASEGTLNKKTAVQLINEQQGQYVQMYEGVVESHVVAVGSLFPDAVLQPNEAAKRSNIIYVPAGNFDRLTVNTWLITTSTVGRIALEWKWDDGAPRPILYHISKDKQRTEMKKDPDGSYSDPENGLQGARSQAEVSLWQ